MTDPQTTVPKTSEPVLAKSTLDRIMDEGMAAYNAGQPITDNPYMRGCEEWSAWREGYDP